MDFTYFLSEVEFEWNAEKAAENVRKHSIAFETACEVFFDPFLQVVNVEDVENERRETIVGLTLEWKTLYVVYVVRDETIRLISARVATKAERLNYENQ